MNAYKEGVVAFLDILGFSKLVSDENSLEGVANLFEFIEKLKEIYHQIEGLEMDFFSDSVILMSDSKSLLSFLFPIYLIETFLREKFGLLLRGGITKGKYYHDEKNSFGPAIVKAYQLEEMANFSRILIDPEISERDLPENVIEVYQDLDGEKCLNIYSEMLWQNFPIEYDGSEYKKDELFEKMIGSLKEIRQTILNSCKQYCGTPHIEKYLWRSRVFNYTCEYISKKPGNVRYLEKAFTKLSNGQIKALSKLKIHYEKYEV